MHILLVEDNIDLLVNIEQHLQREGYVVDCAEDGQHGLALAMHDQYDLVVLDLMLPSLDGLRLCERLREASRDVPVIMVTARDTVPDRLDGFAAGADDYLIKPFSLAELSARIRALLNRSQSLARQRILEVADLKLDASTQAVIRAGIELKLPPTGLRLLEILMRHSPRIVPRQALEEMIWQDEPPTSDSLRTHIKTLRQAIDKPFAFPLLHTIHGVGFQLCRKA